MGKGLLAWWRGRIVSRGLASAALLAVPVAVAAMIGFGTSLSGVAGGLSAVTSGPEAVPAPSGTVPTKLNQAVEALATTENRTPDAPGASGGSDGPLLDGGSIPNITGTPGGNSGTTGGPGGSGPTPEPVPSPPQITLPSPSGEQDPTVEGINGGLNELFRGVNDAVNSLLGQ